MGRSPRIHYPGAISHAMSRGNDGMDIFECPRDFQEFLAILADVKAKTGLIVLAYCLMTNHFHLLVKVARQSLATVMHQLLSRYSHRFNWRRERRGHVFQDRYKAKLCVDDAYMSQVLPYIHRNPVKAGLVADSADWQWSSHRQFIRPPRSTLLDVDRTLSLLGETPSRALFRYGVMMGTPSEWEPDYDEFELPPITDSGPIVRPTMEEIAAATESRRELRFRGISGRTRSQALTAVRRDFAAEAVNRGYRQSEIAHFLGFSPSSVSELLRWKG